MTVPEPTSPRAVATAASRALFEPVDATPDAPDDDEPEPDESVADEPTEPEPAEPVSSSESSLAQPVRARAATIGRAANAATRRADGFWCWVRKFM